MRHAATAGWRYAQYILFALCLGCALLVILLSLDGRTVWSPDNALPDVTTEPADWPQAGTIRDAAGWDWLARSAGGIAVICLSIGVITRRRWLMLTCLTATSLFLAWAAAVAWRYSMDIAAGLIDRTGWNAHPPTQVGAAAQVAALASTLAVLLLLVSIGAAGRKSHHSST